MLHTNHYSIDTEQSKPLVGQLLPRSRHHVVSG